jgi:hypothetical protein
MTRGSHYALTAIAAAGACLALSACGTGSGHAGSAGSAGPVSAKAARAARAAAQTRRFCDSASSFMRSIPAPPTSAHISLAQARANLELVLRATVKGFTSLEGEAPASLRAPLTKIVGVYQAEEQTAATSGSMGQISQAVVKENLSASGDFDQVLKYISVSCRSAAR